MWQILMALYFVFGATNYVLRRAMAQTLGEHNRLINSIFYILFLLPAGIVLAFFFPHNLDVGMLNLMLLLGGGILFPIFYIVAFNANKEVDAGIFAIINNLSPIFTLAVALPLLHESLSTGQFLGVALLVCSGVIAAASQLRGVVRPSWNGLWLCVLSAAVLGVAIAYERFMLGRVDFGAYLIYGWGSQIAWSAILTGSELKKLRMLFKKDTRTKWTLISWGVASALRSVVFIIALKISSASLVSAASDFMSVAVVIAAYLFLRERNHLLFKALAVGVGVVGLLFVAA